MNKKFLTLTILLLFLLTGFGLSVTITDSSQYAGNTDKAPWGEVGYRFKTGATAPVVAALGFIDVSNAHDTTYNGDGLESDVTVTLWDESTATAVAQVTIPSGTVAPLMDNFRYADLAATITLGADKNYVISFNSGSILDHYLQAGTVTLDPYYVGINGSSTWEIRWGGTVGVMPTSTASWGIGMTYGCCNISSVPFQAYKAHNPTPASGTNPAGVTDGATAKVQLKWKTGLDPCDMNNPNPLITSHLLYIAPNSVPFDANFTSVTPVNIPAGSPVDANASYLKTALDYNQLYYWKVDEVLGGDPCHVIGDLWNFTTLLSNPEITLQPENLLIPDGNTAVFTMGATAADPLTYQWYKSTDAQIGADTLIAGADTNVLTIPSASQSTDDLWYYCKVSNGQQDLYTDVVHLWFERLVAQWKMNNDLTDSSGLGFDAAWDSTAGTFDTNAIEGAYSVNLPGSANTFAIVADSNEYFNHHVLGLTVSCWVRSNPSTDWATFLSKQDLTVATSQGRPWAGWGLGRQQDGIPFLTLRGAGTLYAQTGDEMDDGNWHMVTGTYEKLESGGGELRVYLDGSLSNVWTYANPPLMSTTDVTIGVADANNGNGAFDGQIDDARIYTYALTSTDVAAMYNEYIAKDICIDNNYPAADLNTDCKIDFKDIAILADNWLECNLIPVSTCQD